MSPPRTHGAGSSTRAAFLAGMVAGFGLAVVTIPLVVLVAFGFTGALLVGEAVDRSGTKAAQEPPRYTLKVADDGCGIVRSDSVDPPPDSLTWVVNDKEGFQVLGRSADSETHFRHFGGGNFDVVLRAYDGERYVDVSNRVSVSCGVRPPG